MWHQCEGGPTTNNLFNYHSPHPLSYTLAARLTMADSYYENQPHSATTGGSHSPGPYSGQEHHSNHLNGTNGSEYDGRATSPAHTTYGNQSIGDVKPNITGGTSTAPGAPLVRKTLASWVGFSNLPNQVHRRSVR